MRVINRHLKHGQQSQSPDRIVVHAMGEYILHEGTYLYAPDFLDKIGLSAHALIAIDGTVIRCREDSEGAWHAKGYNTDSLGVEFLVKGKHNYASFVKAISQYYLTFDQHCAGVELIREWCAKHDILTIDPHSDLSPGRKVDPGVGFPWDLFINDIEGGKYNVENK